MKLLFLNISPTLISSGKSAVFNSLLTNSDVSKIYIDATNKFEKIFGSKVKLKEDLNGKILLSAKFKSINDLYTILKKLSN